MSKIICAVNIKLIRVNAELGHWTPETRYNLNENREISTKVTVNLRLRPRDFMFRNMKTISLKVKR